MEDPLLRGPALRVIAINAIGSRRPPMVPTKMKGGDKNKEKKKKKMKEKVAMKAADVGEGIIRDIIDALQSSGGTATLDRKIMLMRRDILSAMCYMFKHNEDLKTYFRNNGGFIWAICVMNGIGKSLDNATRLSAAQNINNNQTTNTTASDDQEKKKENESEREVETTKKGEETIATKPRSNSRSDEGYRAPKEAFIFLKMLLNTISTVLMGNPTNQEYFRNEIRFAALAEALQSCHFIEGANAIELCDALLNLAVKGCWPPSCAVYKDLFTEKQKKGPGPDSNTSTPISPMDPMPNSPNNPRMVMDTAAAHQHVYHCPRCSDELLIENPEIFKIIIQLLDSALGKADDKDVVYILNQLSFLTVILPSNQHKISEADVLCDILQHFKPILISTPQKLTEERLKKMRANENGQPPIFLDESDRKEEEALFLEGAAALQSIVLQLIQRIATHHMSLQALRLYLGLMKDTQNFPVSLLVTLVRIARRDGNPVPTYYLDFTARRANVTFPVLENKLWWPPAAGYTISFWLCIGERGVITTDPLFGQTKKSRPGEAKVFLLNIYLFIIY